MREVKRKDRKTGKKKDVLQAPVWTGHADFIHPWEFISFFRSLPEMQADVMLEAKTKDSSGSPAPAGPSPLCPRRGTAFRLVQS